MGTERRPAGRVGEKDAGCHSNAALPSALSCCHYGSEVFRSCRKQSYDSETTEDEATEPLGPMETKAGLGRPQGTHRGPPGEGGGRTTTAVGGEDHHHASDHHRTAALPGGFDPIVERELRALGSRPPGGTAAASATAANNTHLDPSHPARQAAHARGGPPPVRHLGVEPLVRASHANLALPAAAAQGSEESVCVGSDYYGSMFSLYRGRTFSMPL